MSGNYPVTQGNTRLRLIRYPEISIYALTLAGSVDAVTDDAVTGHTLPPGSKTPCSVAGNFSGPKSRLQKLARSQNSEPVTVVSVDSSHGVPDVRRHQSAAGRAQFATNHRFTTMQHIFDDCRMGDVQPYRQNPFAACQLLAIVS